ncbi:MAG: hypothetical protein BWY83_00456 [bacterium ADurb.Bin478]|nr:MAG: hypothetical protein BWY83_00456 [bacterium ADurb.Bin478]
MMAMTPVEKSLKKNPQTGLMEKIIHIITDVGREVIDRPPQSRQIPGQVIPLVRMKLGQQAVAPVKSVRQAGHLVTVAMQSNDGFTEFITHGLQVFAADKLAIAFHRRSTEMIHAPMHLAIVRRHSFLAGVFEPKNGQSPKALRYRPAQRIVGYLRGKIHKG